MTSATAEPAAGAKGVEPNKSTLAPAAAVVALEDVAAAAVGVLLGGLGGGAKLGSIVDKVVEASRGCVDAGVKGDGGDAAAGA